MPGALTLEVSRLMIWLKISYAFAALSFRFYTEVVRKAILINFTNGMILFTNSLNDALIVSYHKYSLIKMLRFLEKLGI